MDKVYLDYNIYTNLADEKICMPPHYTQYAKIYISVAHAEEFFNARNNDKTGNNKVQLDKIELLLTREMNNLGILKPQPLLSPYKSIRIENVFEDIYHSVDTSKNYDTRESIKKLTANMYEFTDWCFKSLQENDRSSINNSNLPPEKIWERPEINSIITEINKSLKENDYGNKNIIPSLMENYGLENAIYLYEFQKLQPYEIKKGMYDNKVPSFSELENVIEILQNLLSACGYRRDKKDKCNRTITSGAYDTEHAIYATYCTYFVTEDEKLRSRLNAIYYFLGLNTRCLSFAEWCKIIEGKSTEVKSNE